MGEASVEDAYVPRSGSAPLPWNPETRDDANQPRAAWKCNFRMAASAICYVPVDE